MIFIFLFLQMFVGAPSQKSPGFQPQLIDSNITIGYGVALGDVDGDKKPDILVADKKQIIWYRNGDWKKFVMTENLTQFDNVCIAAEDINGDGKVEVAVGAQWNPSETKDEEKSGSVHFLIRPEDPTKSWMPLKLYHEVTIHRMRWIRSSNGSYYLMVLPLHGKDNTSGTGRAVNMLIFQYPALLQKPDPAYIISTEMHLTHNFDIAGSQKSGNKSVYIAGKEGLRSMGAEFYSGVKPTPLKVSEIKGAGEVRLSQSASDKFIATIEPMHGNQLVIYTDDGNKRLVIDSSLNEGHALATADILGRGYDQLVAGWRRPDTDGKVGIRLYSKKTASATTWEHQWIDENDMACEDLQIMDMNGDDRLDIIAAGRATHNVKIYWNNLPIKK